MGVHFWPAFTVISVTSWDTNRSNSVAPGPASGPRTDILSESDSALNRTALATTAGCARSRLSMATETVNDTRQCSCEGDSSPRPHPHIIWIVLTVNQPEDCLCASS